MSCDSRQVCGHKEGSDSQSAVPVASGTLIKLARRYFFEHATRSNDCFCTQNLEVSFTKQQYQNPGFSGSPLIFFTNRHPLGPPVLSGPRHWLSFLWKTRSHGVPPGAPPGKGTLPPCPAETEVTMGHVPFVITHRSERSSFLSTEHAAGRIN